MNNLEILKIKDNNGNEQELKVITVLRKPESDKKFVLYTFDETQENVDIYASILKKDESDKFILDSITEQEDWTLIQKAMEELSE